jgi:hypothetical protein
MRSFWQSLLGLVTLGMFPVRPGQPAPPADVTLYVPAMN